MATALDRHAAAVGALIDLPALDKPSLQGKARVLLTCTAEPMHRLAGPLAASLARDLLQ